MHRQRGLNGRGRARCTRASKWRSVRVGELWCLCMRSRGVARASKRKDAHVSALGCVSVWVDAGVRTFVDGCGSQAAPPRLEDSLDSDGEVAIVGVVLRRTPSPPPKTSATLVTAAIECSGIAHMPAPPPLGQNRSLSLPLSLFSRSLSLGLSISSRFFISLCICLCLCLFCICLCLFCICLCLSLSLSLLSVFSLSLSLVDTRGTAVTCSRSSHYDTATSFNPTSYPPAPPRSPPRSAGPGAGRACT